MIYLCVCSSGYQFSFPTVEAIDAGLPELLTERLASGSI